MSRKSPPVAYITKRLQTTSRSVIMDEIEDAPLKNKDKDLLEMCLEGATYKDMALTFNLTEGAIYKWKRQVYEKLFRFEMSKR